MATFARWCQSATDVVGASIGSPPRRASAANASSTVATGMISTPSPATARGVGEVLRRLRGGHEEVVQPGLADGRRLLHEAADGADIAVEVDRAGHRHVGAAEQVARRQLVDQREREGQPGARATDLPGVDADLEGQVHRPGVEGVVADDRRSRVRRVGDQLHVGGHGLGAVGHDAVDGDRDGVARAPVGEGRGHVGGGVDRRAVDLDERVAVLQVLDAGHELGAAPVGDLGAQQLLDLHRAGHHLGVGEAGP